MFKAGKVYAVGDTTGVAHIYAADSNGLYGVMFWPHGHDMDPTPMSWPVDGQNRHFPLLAGDMGDIPGFTPTTPSTADEIADKVVERLVALRIDASARPDDAQKAVDRYQDGWKAGREGMQTELLMDLNATVEAEISPVKREALYEAITLVNRLSRPRPGSAIRAVA